MDFAADRKRMWKYAGDYVREINRINSRLASFLSWSPLVLTYIFIHEAVARYIFGAPTVWANEFGAFVLGSYFLLGAGYTLLAGGHVRMEFLYERWSPRTRAIIDMITFPLLVFYIVSVAWAGSRHVLIAIEINKHTVSMWHVTLVPITMVIPIAATLLLLQGIAIFLQDLSVVVRGKELA